jgi:hypothetical protein
MLLGIKTKFCDHFLHMMIVTSGLLVLLLGTILTESEPRHYLGELQMSVGYFQLYDDCINVQTVNYGTKVILNRKDTLSLDNCSQRMIASISLNQLAPHEGLVWPGTKNKKPEHDLMTYDNLLAIFYLPEYNLKGLVLLCQLLATRNQYHRGDFQLMLRQVILRRLFHFCYGNTNRSNHKMILLSCDDFDISYRGGGRSKVYWSGCELRPHVVSALAFSHIVYNIHAC